MPRTLPNLAAPSLNTLRVSSSKACPHVSSKSCLNGKKGADSALCGYLGLTVGSPPGEPGGEITGVVFGSGTGAGA